MLLSLHPARLSLVALLLVSFVLTDDAHHNSSLNKVGAPVAFARQPVSEVLSIRQEEQEQEQEQEEGQEQEESSETGGSVTSDPTTSSDILTSTTAPPETTETTPSPTATPTDPPTTRTTEPDPTSTSPSTSDPSPTKPTSDIDEQTTPSPTTTPTPSITEPPQTTITTRRTTIREVTSNGSVYSTTDVSTDLIPTNTAAPIDSSPDTSSGMSPQTRKTVIGVVVGVGGAIFIALVFTVFWKFWGRRRSARRAQEDDALMMTSPGEKGDSISTSNPFQSTLESYHAPQRPVNASSNF